MAWGGYTFSEESGEITFDSDFIYDLGEGTHSITITTEQGSLDLVITVYFSIPEIPSTTDGYVLEDTMLGGDFESYDVGLEFSNAQTDEAWGSLANYDDPGKIVDDNGNHALRLGRAEGSSKQYSSAFCIWDPKISQGDILTLKFSYKILGEIANIGENTNVSFVGSSNTDYHLIDIINKTETTREGNQNVNSWPVKFTEGEDGYTDVEMSFIVDFAFMNSTNSLRFLYEIGADTEIYIDNVRLIRWMEEGAEDAEKPVVTAENVKFDGADPKDVTLTVDLKDYNVSTIKCGDTVLKTSEYTVTDDVTLTIKKEFMSTLKDGKHTFTLSTIGGSCEFEITVSNSTASSMTEGKPDGGSNTGLIVGLSVAGAAVVAAGAATAIILVKKKKKKNG